VKLVEFFLDHIQYKSKTNIKIYRWNYSSKFRETEDNYFVRNFTSITWR